MCNIPFRNNNLVGPKPKDRRIHDENSGLGKSIGEPVNGRVEETSPERMEGKGRGGGMRGGEEGRRTGGDEGRGGGEENRRG